MENDGDLDLTTLDLNDKPQILISNLAEKKHLHYLKIALQGQSSNRDGNGAKVTLKSGDKIYTRYVDGKSGYLAQSSMPLYFGLGEQDAVESITVKWPSGTTQTLNSVQQVNRLLKIQERAP